MTHTDNWTVCQLNEQYLIGINLITFYLKFDLFCVTKQCFDCLVTSIRWERVKLRLKKTRWYRFGSAFTFIYYVAFHRRQINNWQQSSGNRNRGRRRSRRRDNRVSLCWRKSTKDSHKISFVDAHAYLWVLKLREIRYIVLFHLFTQTIDLIASMNINERVKWENANQNENTNMKNLIDTLSQWFIIITPVVTEWSGPICRWNFILSFLFVSYPKQQQKNHRIRQ